MNRSIMHRPIMHRSFIGLTAGLALLVGGVLPAQTPAKGRPAGTVTAEASGTVDQGKVATLAGVSRNASTGAKAMPTEITIEREVFNYDRSGRRDPYKSLMSSSDVRPLLSDLRLTVVAFDPDGRNSIAILRDMYSKQQYRIRVGQQLGRLRVSAISEKSVQFTIEEFGFNRQETLALASDTTKVRNP